MTMTKSILKNLIVLFLMQMLKKTRNCQSENVLEGHKRYWPCSSFAPLDSNCPKQRRIFNHCGQVDLRTLEHEQELYTDPCDININIMLFIVQLLWIVTSGKEEKSNTYTHYKREK